MKKKLVLIFAILCCLVLSGGILAACNPDGESQPVSFTVTFEVDGEVYAEVKTQGNEPIKIPDDPIKSGYIFDGWYWDKDTWLEPFTVASLATRPLQENIRVYAKWITDQEAQLGKVTFVTNGGTAVPSARFETIEESPVSVRDGYVLEGWYTDITLSNKVTFPFVVDGDIVLYAKWSAVEYTIEYRLDGGQLEANAPCSYTIETNVKLPFAEKIGYTFEGWYATEDFEGQQIENISAGQTGNKVFYAKWTINSYTIIFESNDGTDVADITKNFGEPIEKPADPEKIGYVFIGWYSNSTCTEPFEFDTMPASDIRLYAKWQAEMYSIKYNLNGGSLEGEYHTEYTYEEAYTLPIPEKSNFVFAGWYDNPSCSGDPIVNIAKGSIGTKEFWAKWEEQGYRITYHLNGGVNGDNTPIYYASSETIILEPASKTGYTFMGWYENEDFEGEKITEITTGSSGNKEFWAKWQINKYTITFDTNGGSPINSITQDYGSRVVVPSDPERAGYTFIGWFADSTLVHEYVFTTIPAEDITVYAKWDVVTYDITFNADGAELPTDIALSYTVEDNITLPLIEKAGHTFNGWYDNAAFEGDVITEIAKGTIGDKQYYAKFTVNQYTLTYEVNGGSAIEPVTQDYATKLTKPADPTKIGYEFIGWYSDAEFMNEFLFGTMPDKNMTIYAKWQIVFYSIEYIADDAVIPDDATVKYTVEDEVVLPILEKIGYTFDGWYNNAEFAGESIEKIEIGTTGDKTYYAKFTINSYTIEFETFGGSVIDSITQNYGTTIIAPQQPQRLGYSFVGWYSDPDFTNEFLFTTMPANDITVYAKWSAIVYEIHYYNVEDAANTNPLTYTVEDSFILRAPVRNGYNFDFWYQNGDIDVRITEIAKGTTGDLYLYASWIKADNGYSIVTAPNYAFISDTELKTVINYDVTEFDFRGTFAVSPNATWRVFTEENCSQPSELTLRTATDLQEGDNYYYVLVENQSTYQSQVYTLNVHRRWQYEVNFYGKDGSLVETMQLIEGASITDEMIPAASDLTDIGYRLLGWYFDSAFEEEYAVGSAILKNQKTINLYSEYEAIVYSITYVLNGGENAESNVAEYTVESESLLLADPSRTNFSFDGWWLSDSYEGKITEIHPTDLKDYTLYAKWVPYLIEKDDDGNVTITSYTGTEQDVDIPSAINGCPVTAIGENAFNGRTDIISVKIPDSVVSMGANAFEGCSSITYVEIGANVGNIGTNAFTDCIRLVEVRNLSALNINAGSTSYGRVGYYAIDILGADDVSRQSFTPDGYHFYYDTTGGLLIGYTGDESEVVLPIGFTAYDGTEVASYTIYKYAFNDLTIKSAVIAENVIGIEKGAFAGCNELESITLPFIGEAKDGSGATHFGFIFGASSYSYNNDYVPTSLKHVTITGGTGIEGYAFHSCSGLIAITVPNSVTSIGDYAFYGCSGLASFTIPDSVTSIGNNAFTGCSNIISATMPTLAIDYIPQDSLQTVVLTSGESIGNYAFRDCNVLTSITISDSVTSIGSYAFQDCSGLISLIIPDSVTSIGRNAFDGCIAEIVWGDNPQITEIGSYAFSGYEGTSVTIPDSIITIGDNAFYNCNNLTSVTIPDGVTSIGNYAFSGCSSLASVTLGAGVTDIGDRAFNCAALNTVNWNAVNVTDFDRSSDIFYNAGNEGEGIAITFGDSVTNVPAYLFYASNNSYYPNVKSVAFGENIKSIGAYSFAYTDVESVNIPDSVETIGEYAFYYSSAMTPVTIGSGITSIGSRAFSNCDNLTEVHIADLAAWYNIEFESSDANPLYYAHNLYLNDVLVTDLVIPESVTAIKPYAFYGAHALTSVTLHEGVTQIGTNAFSECYKLVEVYNKSDLSIQPGSYSSPGQVSQYADNVYTNIDGSWFTDTQDGYRFFYDSRYSYQKTGYLMGYFGDESALSLPDGFTAYDGTEISNYTIHSYAFENMTDLTSVIIPDSVTSIGSSAFYGCSSLTSITIPDSVTSIGDSAFYDCDGLISVTIGNGVSRIGSYAFSSCDNLTSIYYTGDVTGWCRISGLNNVMASERTLYIGGEKIEGAITVPDGVRSIPSYAFAYQAGITSVTIPDSTTSIGSSAFRDCTGLTSVTVPDNVTGIGDATFYGCVSLTEINWDAVAIEDFTRSSNVFYNAGTSVDGTTVTFGDSVTSIPAYLFYVSDASYRPTVKSIIIGNNVTSIGNYAFAYCDSLTSITIPDSVTSIGDGAFRDCTGLTSITIPDSVTSIGNSAFYNCNGLTYVLITDIAAWCGIYFADNTANPLYYAHNLYLNGELVTDLVISGSITSIGEHAFYNCTGLMSVTIPNGVMSIGNSAFSGCTGLASVSIPDSVTSIGNYAFQNCSNLTSVIIPDSVTSIGNNAFYGCSAQIQEIEGGVIYVDKWAIDYENNTTTTVVLRDGTIGIADYAFGHWDGLTSITIPDSVTGIGDSAFYDCDGLISVTIGNGVTSIGSSAFYDCSGLTSVTIGNSVTSIGESAFYSCNSLVSIHYTGNIASWLGKNWHSRVMSSGRTLYLDGEKVEGAITVPDGVDSIPSYAFAYQAGITSVIISDSATSIGSYAFRDCTGLTSVTIPDSVTSIGSSAFEGCSSLESITIPFVGAEAGKASSDAYQYPFGYIFGTSSYDGGTAVRQYYHGISASSTTSTTYYIPSSLRSVIVTGGNILYGAFYNCYMLTSVTIGNGVTSIGERAFSGCTGLTSATIGNGVTSIGERAFSGCTGLTSVTIGDSVTSIGSYAFSNCSDLTSVTIGNCVTNIGDEAFYGCTALLTLVVGEGVQRIGRNAFSGCTALESVVWNAISVSDLNASSGVFENAGSVGEGIVVTVGDKVEYIPAYLFYGNEFVKNVVFGDNQPEIGDNAFTSISSNSVVYEIRPEGLTAVGYSGTESGAEIAIMDGTVAIADSAFKDCTTIAAITIPDSVTSIGDSAFENCTSLTSLTVGEGVAEVGTSAFAGCSALTEIMWNAISANESDGINVNNGALFASAGSAGNGITVTFGDSVQAVPSIMFGSLSGGVANIVSVIFGSNVSSIGVLAFSGCKSLQTIVIPETVKTIGGGAFLSSGLTSVTLHSDITFELLYIGPGVFMNCDITEIHYNGSLTDWLNDTDGVYEVMSVGREAKTLYVNGEEISGQLIVPDGVASIPAYAFYNCTGITSAIIPDSVMSVGRNAFEGCSNLPNENGVYYADDWAVACGGVEGDALGNMVIREGTYGIAEQFTNGYHGAILTVFIPASVQIIGSGAFDVSSSGLMTINCEAQQQPSGWAEDWYKGNEPTINWGCSNIVTSNSEFDYYVVNGEAYLSKYKGTGGEVIVDTVDGYPVADIGTVFFANENITSLSIEGNVSTIATYAIYGCIALESVHIGASVKEIQQYGVFYCPKVDSITVDPANSVYHSDSNCLISTADKVLLFGCKSSVIPSDGSVASIGDGAFYGCYDLTSIIIPDCVTNIGESAFEGCSEGITEAEGGVIYVGNWVVGREANVSSVVLREGTVGIADKAFYQCATLKSVSIPDSVMYIGTNAFYACGGLTSVTMGNNITHIGEYAFMGCNITSIVIPASVTYIGENAFAACNSLESAIFEETSGWWYAITIGTETDEDELSSDSLTDPSSAAQCITYYLNAYFWRKV